MRSDREYGGEQHHRSMTVGCECVNRDVWRVLCREDEISTKQWQVKDTECKCMPHVYVCPSRGNCKLGLFWGFRVWLISAVMWAMPSHWAGAHAGKHRCTCTHQLTETLVDKTVHTCKYVCMTCLAHTHTQLYYWFSFFFCAHSEAFYGLLVHSSSCTTHLAKTFGSFQCDAGKPTDTLKSCMSCLFEQKQRRKRKRRQIPGAHIIKWLIQCYLPGIFLSMD